MSTESFSDIAVIACGTLSPELNYLQKEGFLDTHRLYYTKPGLHQDITELERQLVNHISRAREKVDKVLVIHGKKFSYVKEDEPARAMGKIIGEQGPGVAGIQAAHCMDMLASKAERENIAREIAGGQKVWWMTPGCIKYREDVFKGWDKGVANRNFPRYTGGAIVLDSIGYLDRHIAEKTEEFLKYAWWMGIPIQPYPISLERFKSLLLEQASQF